MHALNPQSDIHWQLGRRTQGLLLLPLLLLLWLVNSLPAADTNALLNSWFEATAKCQTWSADFTQTRALKSLLQPLTATGHVWFAAPNRFRWEMGNPAQTIAVRDTNSLWLIYPKLKRAEKYTLEGAPAGQWREAMALMETGFARNRLAMEKQFRLTALVSTPERHEITLQPRSASARRWMQTILVVVAVKDFSLRATEIRFADGSVLRNDFARDQLNPPLEPKLFQADVDASFTLVEPLAKPAKSSTQ